MAPTLKNLQDPELASKAHGMHEAMEAAQRSASKLKKLQQGADQFQSILEVGSITGTGSPQADLSNNLWMHLIIYSRQGEPSGSWVSPKPTSLGMAMDGAPRT
jgi:hypothetical protein